MLRQQGLGSDLFSLGAGRAAVQVGRHAWASPPNEEHSKQREVGATQGHKLGVGLKQRPLTVVG